MTTVATGLRVVQGVAIAPDTLPAVPLPAPVPYLAGGLVLAVLARRKRSLKY